jgi:hypothetical protein
MGILHKLSSLLCLLSMFDNNTMYKGRVSISVFLLEIYNYQIYNEFLSNNIKTIKCLPIYHTIKVHSYECFHSNGGATIFPKYFKNVCAGAVQLFFLFLCTGSLDEMWMLLHHTPRLKRFHGLLSMSSCTVCPCFWITASVSQLASSTGWFFHFTRYSKYCFLLVFFPTLLSSMHSI